MRRPCPQGRGGRVRAISPSAATPSVTPGPRHRVLDRGGCRARRVPHRAVLVLKERAGGTSFGSLDVQPSGMGTRSSARFQAFDIEPPAFDAYRRMHPRPRAPAGIRCWPGNPGTKADRAQRAILSELWGLAPSRAVGVAFGRVLGERIWSNVALQILQVRIPQRGGSSGAFRASVGHACEASRRGCCSGARPRTPRPPPGTPPPPRPGVAAALRGRREVGGGDRRASAPRLVRSHFGISTAAV